uniref:Cytochrome P450 n=1 Tax=Phanerodontia chrysosporium TaxID=2822231 RepID=G5EJU0_PHACH|nr:cytochrome P450 [Phanerodontia chrysosporium]
MGFLTALLLVFVLLCVALVRAVRRRRARPPYPPGPPADPLIGHIRIMPSTDNAHEVFHDWAQQYGDVMSLDVLGTRYVILNSAEAATDLLEKRNSKYADRPTFPMYERVGWKDTLVFLPYGPYFRKQRKMLQLPLGEGESHRLPTHRGARDVRNALHIMSDPDNTDAFVHRYTTAVTMELAYGHRVVSNDDEYLKAADMVIDVLRSVTRPSLLDVSPIFEYLPAWFPGAWFVKCIKEIKPVVLREIQHPVSVVQQELMAGTAKPSFVSQQLEDLSRESGLSQEDLYTVSMVAHQIFGGGSETGWHTIMTFIACMLTNPDVQRKGEEELDSVVGRGRLPDFTDRDSLPYIDCIVKETMRWQPVVPLSVPHKAMEDDEYRGMHIPKGATIIPNARSITWDERHFHEPRTYKPERFLPRPQGAGEDFPQGAVFGWGRRLCPGRYLADDVVWLAIARILAVFDIQKAVDADGNVVEPHIEFTTVLTSHPKPFPCSLRPRSEKAAELVRQAYDMHMANVAV